MTVMLATLPLPNNSLSKMKKFDANTFGKAKREKLLDYKIYSYNFEDNVETSEIVSEDIPQPPDVLATIPISILTEATRERA